MANKRVDQLTDIDAVASGDSIPIRDDSDSAELKEATMAQVATFIDAAGVAAAAISSHAALTSGVHGISAFGATLVDDADAAAARTTLDVDQAGTDNSTDVTLTGTPDYITIAGQTITRNAVDLAADVTGTLPVANGGTGATYAAGIRSAINVEDGADVTDAANVETAIEAISLTSITGATGDEVLVIDDTDGGLKAVLWQDLPGAGGGLSNVADDLTPQLGGMLDVNGQAIGDGTRELVTFVEDASAVNHLEIENQATGSGPILRAAGDDTNIDLNLSAKGSGGVAITGAVTVSSTVDGRDLATDGSKLDGIEALADVTDATNVAAAGALMESAVDLDIKTLSLPASTTISAFGASLVDDADAATARTTLGLGNAATLSVDADIATLSLPASTTISAFGATLVDDADAATARATLELGSAAVAGLIDEDDMASDSASAVPSQQSVKAYVDANAGGGGGGVVLSYRHYNPGSITTLASSSTTGGDVDATNLVLPDFTMPTSGLVLVTLNAAVVNSVRNTSGNDGAFWCIRDGSGNISGTESFVYADNTVGRTAYATVIAGTPGATISGWKWGHYNPNAAQTTTIKAGGGQGPAVMAVLEITS
jgi:hypothetical protein